MKLRDDDKKWLAAEIARQLKQARDSFQPRGWRKLVHLLRELGPIAATIGIIVTLMAIALGALYQSFAHVKEETEFRTRTNDRLESIEEILRVLRASQFPGAVLNEIVRLDQKNFARSLPALRKVTEQPVPTVNPTEATLREVADKLRNIQESSPDYWPTVLQFIRFASAGLSVDVPPPDKPDLVLRNNSIIGRNVLGILKHRIVLLDGGELIDQRFENSRIIFTEIPVRMQNVEFIDCVFEMPTAESPNPYLRQASHQLLASNFNSVIIKAL